MTMLRAVLRVLLRAPRWFVVALLSLPGTAGECLASLAFTWGLVVTYKALDARCQSRLGRCRPVLPHFLGSQLQDVSLSD